MPHSSTFMELELGGTIFPFPFNGVTFVFLTMLELGNGIVWG